MKKTLLEVRNFLKELLKGTFLEPFAKFVVELIKPINRRDDNWMTQIMHRVLTADSNCIDVGCNMGDFLSQMLRLAPRGYHYAFEPIPRLANRLRKKFPAANVQQVALSNSEQETTFWYVVSAPALSSLKQGVAIDGLKKQDNDSTDLVEPIPVKTQRLDDILPPDFSVNFIKLDVEGAELQVFQGATRTLKTHKPYVVFEHGGSDAYKWHDGKWHDYRIYDLLVHECGLQIYELKHWLEGLAPLTREQFAKSHAWNFLAAP